jgi:competence protein ComEC
MKFPALAIAFSLAAGILAGGVFLSRLTQALGICLLSSLFFLLMGFLLFLGHRHALAGVASLLAWCLLGAAAARLEPLTVPADHITHQIAATQLNLSQPLRWRGRLRSDPLRLPWGLRYEIDLDEVQSAGIWRPVSGGLRVGYFFNERDAQAEQDAAAANAAGDGADTNTGANTSDIGPVMRDGYRAGDRVEILVRAAPARNFADPGSFDYKAFLARQQIDLTGFVRSAALMTRIPGPPPTLAHRLARVRGHLLNELDAMLGGDATPNNQDSSGRAAVARAMLLGDRSFLDSEQIQAFQETGAYHVLVLAGLHVGVLAAAFFWIGRVFRLPRVASTLVSICALAFYVAIVQDRPPILRAALVATIYLLARLIFRRTALLNSVGLAALAILIVRPSELADPSFQLSFLAALTIAGVAAPLLNRSAEQYRRALDHLGDVTRDGAATPRAAQFRLDLRATANWLAPRLPRSLSRFAASSVTTPCRVLLRLWELVVISVAIQIGMLPLMAQYFHRISPAGLAANIPAVLLTAIIVPMGFLALGAGIISSGFAHALGRVLSAAVGALLASVDRLAHTHWASFRVPSPPELLLVAFFVAGTALSVALLAAWRWPARLAATALLVFAALIIAYPFSPRLEQGQLEVIWAVCRPCCGISALANYGSAGTSTPRIIARLSRWRRRAECP